MALGPPLPPAPAVATLNAAALGPRPCAPSLPRPPASRGAGRAHLVRHVGHLPVQQVGHGQGGGRHVRPRVRRVAHGDAEDLRGSVGLGLGPAWAAQASKRSCRGLGGRCLLARAPAWLPSPACGVPPGRCHRADAGTHAPLDAVERDGAGRHHGVGRDIEHAARWRAWGEAAAGRAAIRVCAAEGTPKAPIAVNGAAAARRSPARRVPRAARSTAPPTPPPRRSQGADLHERAAGQGVSIRHVHVIRGGAGLEGGEEGQGSQKGAPPSRARTPRASRRVHLVGTVVYGPYGRHGPSSPRLART